MDLEWILGGSWVDLGWILGGSGVDLGWILGVSRSILGGSAVDLRCIWVVKGIPWSQWISMESMDFYGVHGLS